MDVYKLDSIEDGVAAVETPDGMMLYLGSGRFPENAESGDCFILENGIFIPAPEETENRRSIVSGLLDELMKKK